MVWLCLFCPTLIAHMFNRVSTLVFGLAALLFFATVLYTFREVDILGILQGITFAELIEVLLLGLVFHLSFGVIMWVGFLLHYKLKLKPIEILTLPMMMHLFLYLMPMKGGMLFQVFYTKHKYNLDLSKGFSLGMTVFFNSIFLTVFLGLGLAYLIPVESVELRATILAMGIGLLGLVFGLKLIPSNLKTGSGIITSLVNFLLKVRVQLEDQVKNMKLFFGLLITTFISVTVQTYWIWITAQTMGIYTGFAPMYLMVLILRIILLIRILPGNLGIQEVMIGAVFAAAGFNLEDGLLLGVITRLISVFWTAIIGLPALYSNLKYFNSVSLRGLIQKVGRSE
ncbi:MAG: flippase-like domain-containing protein [Flavobacteriales bacterium]|nr:flippase-like domain-containing protein [Flavobacteriales bacterium]